MDTFIEYYNIYIVYKNLFFDNFLFKHNTKNYDITYVTQILRIIINIRNVKITIK